MKRTGKNIVSFLTSFVLMFFLIIFMLLSFFKFTILDDNFYYKVLDETRAIDVAEESILFEIKYILLSNNLPIELADNIITHNEINDNIYSLTSGILNFFIGESKEIKNINTEVYKQRIRESIENYLRENNFSDIDFTFINEAEEAVDNIIATEVEPLDLNKISTSDYGSKLRDLTKVLNSFIPLLVCFVISIILIGILIFTWKRIRAVAWIGYSFFSSGLLIFLIGFSGYISKFYNNIAVISEIVKENISLILERYLINLSVIGVVFLLIGLICMIFYWIHIYKREKRMALKMQ